MYQLQVRAGFHLPLIAGSYTSPVSPCVVKAIGTHPSKDRARNLTASPRSSDPSHPAGQRLPRSPLALLTRAGGHTAEFSLQLGTLAGLAAVLGGHAGPHPAPRPPPAAAGAQAPGPPLLPHAVHCKEARGRWLGGTLAPPTASAYPSAHQSGVPQFYAHSLLAPPWIRLPGQEGLGSQDSHPLWGCGPKSHRTGSVDTQIGWVIRTSLRSYGLPFQRGTGKPRKGSKIHPSIPFPPLGPGPEFNRTSLRQH